MTILRYVPTLTRVTSYDLIKNVTVDAGRRLVLQPQRDKLLLLDPESQAEIHSPITVPPNTFFLAVNETGERAVIEHSDGTLWSYRVTEDGQVNKDHQLLTKDELCLHHPARISVTFSRDGKLALISSEAYIANGILWDLDSGQEVGPIYISQGALIAGSAAFSPDGTYLITGGGVVPGAYLFKLVVPEKVRPQVLAEDVQRNDARVS